MMLHAHSLKSYWASPLLKKKVDCFEMNFFYYFIVINIILMDVFHDVSKSKKAKQLCYKKRHKKLYCLEYVFQKISFKCL